MFSGFILAIVFAILAVGLVEVVKGFLPDTLNSKIKEIISLAIEVVVAIIGAVVAKSNGVISIIITIIGTISFAQLFYTTIIASIKKLTDFLKSKTN